MKKAIDTNDSKLLQLVFQKDQTEDFKHPSYRVLFENIIIRNHVALLKCVLTDGRIKVDSNAFAQACLYGHLKMVQFMLENSQFDPVGKWNLALCWSVGSYKHFEILCILLPDARFEVSLWKDKVIRTQTEYQIVRDAAQMCLPTKKINRIVDYGFSNFFSSKDDNIFIDQISQCKTRFSQVCIGIQDLSLPALVTLEILDALLPNDIRMAAKWDLIVAVKHFHDCHKTLIHRKALAKNDCSN